MPRKLAACLALVGLNLVLNLVHGAWMPAIFAAVIIIGTFRGSGLIRTVMLALNAVGVVFGVAGLTGSVFIAQARPTVWFALPVSIFVIASHVFGLWVLLQPDVKQWFERQRESITRAH